MKIKKEDIKQAIGKMIDKDYDGWPPECMGLWYQPYRPRKQPAAQKKLLEQTKIEKP